jgi:Tol biopolymer transport system component
LAVSPDGTSVVFVGKDSPASKHLWLRPLASETPTRLTGTDGANAPFWSPDGRRIGFFAGGMLKTIELATQGVTELAAAPQPRGGAWSVRNVIVFAPSPSGGLYKVPAGGGTATAVTRPDDPSRAWSHRWPSFLPGGDRFLFVKWHGSEAGLYVGSLSSAEAIHVSDDALSAVYVDKMILIARDKAVQALPFDLRRLKLSHDPFYLGGVAQTDTGRSDFAIAGDTLAVTTESARSNLAPSPRQLWWFDRTGRALSPLGRGEIANGIELSPDERFVTMAVGTGIDVPIWEVERPTGLRGSFPAPAGRGPLWSPDGQFVAYPRLIGDHEHPMWEFVQRPAGGGPERVLASNLTPGSSLTSWSPDGSVLLYHSRNADAAWDIWAVPNREHAQPTRLVRGRESAAEAQFSPDGRWIAYASDETSRLQVYTEPYPPTGERFAVTTEGGSQPRWRRDGKELFYVANDRFLTAVDIQTSPAFKAGLPHRLFEARFPPGAGFFHEFAVMANGWFLVNTSAAPEPSAQVAIVLNWRGALTTRR